MEIGDSKNETRNSVRSSIIRFADIECWRSAQSAGGIVGVAGRERLLVDPGLARLLARGGSARFFGFGRRFAFCRLRFIARTLGRFRGWQRLTIGLGVGRT